MNSLEIVSVRALRGPNVWAQCKVLDASLYVGALNDDGVKSVQLLSSRIAGAFSSAGLSTRLGAMPEAPAALEGQALFLAEAIARVTVVLQVIAGSKVQFHRAMSTAKPGVYRLVIEFEEEDLARTSLDTARLLCLSALRGEPFDLSAAIKPLRDMADDICLGPSTRAIVQAALDRGIPVRRLNTGSLVQFGNGVHQRRICAAETDRTGAIGEMIAGDKQLAKQLLRAVGVPVPEGRVVANAEEAWKAACELGGSVVVKPLDGNHGRAVFIGLTGREEIAFAFKRAEDEGTGVLVERCLSGSEHRLLVVGGELIAATRGDALHIVGDGVRTVAQLVDELNRDPRRGEDSDCPLSLVEFDSPNRASLAHQGYSETSIPAEGVRVLVQRNGNLSIDVTDDVHPENAANAVLAARTIGLEIAGIDIVVDHISRPLRGQNGAIVEVNAAPGLQMHLQPAAGTPRPAGEKIMALMFPNGATGRIPIVAVHSAGDAAPLAQAISQLIQAAGLRTGLACAAGTFVDGRRIDFGAVSGAGPAADLLLHPFIEAAVIETTDAGILGEGLAFDQCQLAVLADAGAPDSRDARQLLLSTVVPEGTVVVHAEEPLDPALAALPHVVVVPDGTVMIAAAAAVRSLGLRAPAVNAGPVEVPAS